MDIEQQAAVTLTEYIEELKRLQVQHGNLRVMAYDPENIVRPSWPEFGVDNKRKGIILI